MSAVTPFFAAGESNVYVAWQAHPSHSGKIQANVCGITPHWKLGVLRSIGALSACFHLRGRGSIRFHKGKTACASAELEATQSAVTELLVDADTHHAADVTQVLTKLRQSCGQVRGTIFAEPDRLRNQEWKDLLNRHGLKFCAVRRVGAYVDPNDEVIIRHMRGLSSNTFVQRVALLSQDTDFLQSVQYLCDCGKEVLVFMAREAFHTVQDYERAGATVIPLDRRQQLVYTVKALLHADGSGSVQRCEPIPHRLLEVEVPFLQDFWTKLRYCAGSEKPILSTCISKFWLTNRLGTLTVYPASSCISEVYQLAHDQVDKSWMPYDSELAYFFPVHNSGRASQVHKSGFGNLHELRVFKSNGPFMLEDSAELASEALQKLGYMDTFNNADLHELMLVFANTGRNKKLLRKTEALPAYGDSPAAVEGKLRRAFLSNQHGGQWQRVTSDADVRRLLLQEKFLPVFSAPQGEVLEAMRSYSQQKGWPKMQTYNGYVWQLVSATNRRDPKRREPVGLHRPPKPETLNPKPHPS